MLRLIHPALIHFPIALLLTGVLLTAAYLRAADPFLERSAYGAFILGWWGTVLGVATGLVAAALQWPYEPATLNWVNAHAVASFVLLGVAGRALLLRKRDATILQGPRRRPYLLLLAATALLVIVTGWLGGHLVYTLKLTG